MCAHRPKVASGCFYSLENEHYASLKVLSCLISHVLSLLRALYSSVGFHPPQRKVSNVTRNCPWQKLAWCWCASSVCTCAYIYAVCDSSAVGWCTRPLPNSERVRQSVSQCGACVRLAAFICVQSQRVDWYHVQIKVVAAIFPARTRGYELHTAILCFMLLLTVASVCFNARACFFYTNYIWSARAIVFFLAISNDNLRLRNSHVESLERQESVLACEHVHNCSL